MPDIEFWQAVEQFNQQEYYQCHDTLEALWMEAAEPDRAFYQGILQIAVACYHLGNQNIRGAVILLGEGLRRIRDYQPIYYKINVTELMSQSSQLLWDLQQIIPEDDNKKSLENRENSRLNSIQYTFPKIIIERK